MFKYNLEVYSYLGQFIFMGLVLGFLEGSGKFQLSYSKFRKGGGVSTRLAMFLIYFIPLVVYAWGWYAAGRPASIYHLALLAAFTGHFGKRVLESLFLHKYSRPVGWLTPILITAGYSFLAFNSQRIHHGLVTMEMGNDPAHLTRIIAGGVIFLAGQAMNFRHHLLLAGLRRGDDGSYAVPQGGLFPLVACPHYFFEIIAWMGFAIMSAHILVAGMVFIMSAYLMGRSWQTSKWYKENLANYPAERKALIPFVF